MWLGLRTVIYPSTDLEAAKGWYSQVTGTLPYFVEPFYVGFHVGGFELGLVPAGPDEPAGHGLAYWGVSDIATEVDRLVKKLGATVAEAIQDVGGGIRVATLLDPSGNRLGLIENPHFRASEVR